ncbi:MAG: NUDIX domain-containing protein [Candidatus Nomurabacteria bacterium]|nr:NUDIX domain-containing protein [Candidatus Nomurabacteria bacterium]
MNFRQKIKKTFYFFRNPIYKLYCFIFRPKSLGVKTVVENNDGKILMVRISYAHRKWTFPGGGVKRKESFEEAAIRELEEEVGIKTQHLIEMGGYISDRNFKKNIVKCFYLKVDSSFVRIDNFEISELIWCNPGELPEGNSFSVPEILEIYKNFKSKTI